MTAPHPNAARRGPKGLLIIAAILGVLVYAFLQRLNNLRQNARNLVEVCYFDASICPSHRLKAKLIESAAKYGPIQSHFIQHIGIDEGLGFWMINVYTHRHGQLFSETVRGNDIDIDYYNAQPPPEP